MHERRLEQTSLLYFISFNPKPARGKSRYERVNIPPPHGHADNFMSIDRVSWFITARPDSVYAPHTSSSSHFLTKIDAWKFARALASRLSVCSSTEGPCEIQPEKCLPSRNQRRNERTVVGRINWFCSSSSTKVAGKWALHRRVRIAAKRNSASMISLISSL